MRSYVYRFCSLLFFYSFLFIYFLIFPSPAFAVSVTITNYPSTIASDSFTITASISGAQAGTNYLKIDLYKDTSTNYFGETYTGSTWYSGSEGTQLYPITIPSGDSWMGQIQGRVGSPSVTEYDGQGSYKLRLRRYTSSGNSYNSDEAKNSAVTIAIVVPTVTPIPAATATPTSVPTPTKVPTAVPTIKSAVTVAAVAKITLSPSVRIKSSTKSGKVLGSTIKTHVSPTVVENQKQKGAQQVKSLDAYQFNISHLFIVLGFLLLLACGILVLYPRFKDKLPLWKKQ